MRIEYKYDLTAQNTFRMRVSCACYIEYDKAEDLHSIDWKNLPQPIMHIGSGSNLLFTGDFPGTVLHSKIQYIKYVDMGLDEVPVAVGAGVLFDDFVAKACEDGMWGAENLSAIPGTVGASAVQNIGAYGAEVKDIVSGVVCFDTQTLSKRIFKPHECEYAYRDSFFKQPENKGRYIVTGVLFRLKRNYSPNLEYKPLKEKFQGRQDLTPQLIRDEVIALRHDKLPDPKDLGSAGSYFKNPIVPVAKFAQIASGYTTVPHYLLDGGMVKIPAAWMIEQCGLKGYKDGNVGVYEKQPLVIVNLTGNAQPAEILNLEKHIISKVFDKFGVELHTEVEHV